VNSAEGMSEEDLAGLC